MVEGIAWTFEVTLGESPALQNSGGAGPAHGSAG